MRVLIAPGDFAGQLSAGQVGAAIAAGWARTAPGDEVVITPLSDGGPGFVEAVRATLGGELVTVTVSGPLGDPVPATVLICRPVAQPGVTTAYIEAAQACGLHLLRPEARDAGRATTYGVGELLAAAVSALPDRLGRIVVGVGGTATNDGGAGLLAAMLPADPSAGLGGGGLALAGLEPGELSGLADLRQRLRGVELVLAAASDIRLLGFHGTSATTAEAKGASPEQAQALESALGHFADLAGRSLVAGRSLLADRRTAGPATEPGSGAGGGLGFALLLLGATYVDGVGELARVCDLTSSSVAARRIELLVSAEAVFDWRSLRGGVVARVAQLGLEAGVPAVVLAREVLVGRREAMTVGLSGSYALMTAGSGRGTGPDARRFDPAAELEDLAARVARTWSRRP